MPTTLKETKNVMVAPNGNEYKCILWANHLGSGWEWYGFEVVETRKDGDKILFGYVMGHEDEFGYFSLNELMENKVYIVTNPNDIRDLQPPVGWTRKDGDVEEY